MAKKKRDKRLVSLTLRFLGTRKDDPDRFSEDPKRKGYPDRHRHAPDRPLSSAEIADLFYRGNVNYAGFINACRKAAKHSPPKIEGVNACLDHYLFLGREEVALSKEGSETQNPYAAVLGCIDSRVPVELVMGQAADDVFVIRTAGNILCPLGEACGSMQYILDNYALDSPNPHGHRTLSAILILGHTRCGAVSAAYDAFKPNGSGTTGMPPSLEAILHEIKWSVDFVRDNCSLTDPEKIKDAIAMVNSFHSHLKVKRMVHAMNPNSQLKVFYGTYSVTDFYLQKTNIPGFPKQHLPSLLADRGIDTQDFWSEEKSDSKSSIYAALARDAEEFASREAQ